jgi:hypothetical protein
VAGIGLRWGSFRGNRRRAIAVTAIVTCWFAVSVAVSSNPTRASAKTTPTGHLTLRLSGTHTVKYTLSFPVAVNNFQLNFSAGAIAVKFKGSLVPKGATASGFGGQKGYFLLTGGLKDSISATLNNSKTVSPGKVIRGQIVFSQLPVPNGAIAYEYVGVGASSQFPVAQTVHVSF